MKNIRYQGSTSRKVSSDHNLKDSTMARFSPLAVAVLAALGNANGFVIRSTMPGMKPLQMVSAAQRRNETLFCIQFNFVRHFFTKFNLEKTVFGGRVVKKI